MQNVDTLLDVIYWYARKQSLHVTIDLSGSGVKGIHWREAFSLRRWRWIVHTIDLDSLKRGHMDLCPNSWEIWITGGRVDGSRRSWIHKSILSPWSTSSTSWYKTGNCERMLRAHVKVSEIVFLRGLHCPDRRWIKSPLISLQPGRRQEPDPSDHLEHK